VRILVTFALENEFAPWQASHNFKPAKLGSVEVHVAEFSFAHVTAVLTGVGARRIRIIRLLHLVRTGWRAAKQLRYRGSTGRPQRFLGSRAR
jgi:hypothetical protein